MNTVTKIYKKVLNFLYALADTGKVKIKTSDEGLKVVKYRLFGKTLCTSQKRDGKRVKSAPRDKNLPVVYLKANKDEYYSLQCIQKWLDVVNGGGYDYYFVCDNKLLESKILRKCIFTDGNIKFLRSKRHKLKRTAQHLYTGIWEYATYAHLTPFWHAKKHGTKCHWDIDADDTLFMAPAQLVTEALGKVERIAEADSLSAATLDMWYSKLLSRHWTFGVAYIRDTVDYLGVFANQKSDDWVSCMSIESMYNIDWYMTYLKEHRGFKHGVFYIDSCYFVHWGRLLLDPKNAWVSCWHDGKIHLPILDFLKRPDFATFDIGKDCYRIDEGLTLEKSVETFNRDNKIDPLIKLDMNL